MCPQMKIHPARRFPMYTGFPCSKYYQRVRLPLWHQSAFRCASGLFYLMPTSIKTTMDLPGSSTFPFSDRAVRLYPAGVSGNLAIGGCLHGAFRRNNFVGPRTMLLRGLHRFTCVTARSSLCLHLNHVVTSMSLRLDSQWGGFTPCWDGNFTRWKRQAFLAY